MPSSSTGATRISRPVWYSGTLFPFFFSRFSESAVASASVSYPLADKSGKRNPLVVRRSDERRGGLSP